MPRPGQTQSVRLIASLLGLSFLVWTVLLGEAAAAHMSALGQLCGGSTPHCPACYAAVGSALAAVATFAAAFRPQARAVRIRTRA